jgi:hypothetical protein
MIRLVVRCLCDNCDFMKVVGSVPEREPALGSEHHLDQYSAERTIVGIFLAVASSDHIQLH